jgi:hypothetical protein
MLLLLVGATSALLLSPARLDPRCAAARSRAGPICATEDSDPPVDEDFSKKLYDALKKRDDGVVDPELSTFTDDLYAHLSKRPEYATSEFYKGLKARVDVDEPLYSELDRRRDMLMNASSPNPSMGPSDVIELVLLALQDVDYPYSGHGIDVLLNFTGPGSSIKAEEANVTPDVLLKYLETTKYRILLDWVTIQYPKKLEMAFNGKRAFQQLRLKSLNGAWVTVVFQLKQHEISSGTIWLIDQFLVKSAERRGDAYSEESSLFD